jgi:alpha/beta superfamily hydrolase
VTIVEASILIRGKGPRLEGLLETVSERNGVVITHPHPLYGGDMHNAVVDVVRRTCVRIGLTTLRFNFRGVGASEGRYDEGEGEQQDLIAALDFLKTQGIEAITLVGYSFGAWISARLHARRERLERLVMISPPVAFVSFDDIERLPALDLVITGDRDEIAPRRDVHRRLLRWNPEAVLEIIPGSDHFYGGYFTELEAVIAAHLTSPHRR